MPGFEIIENSERDLSRYRKLPKEPSVDNEKKHNLSDKEIDLANNIVKQGASIINKGLDIVGTKIKEREERLTVAEKANASAIISKADAESFVAKSDAMGRRDKQYGDQVITILQMGYDNADNVGKDNAANMTIQGLKTLSKNPNTEENNAD